MVQGDKYNHLQSNNAVTTYFANVQYKNENSFTDKSDPYKVIAPWATDESACSKESTSSKDFFLKFEIYVCVCVC